MRGVIKETKIANLQKRCKRLLAQIEAQAQFIARKRDAVDFSPSDADGVAAFLQPEREKGSSPFARWFAGEKADALRAEAARQEEAMAKDAGIDVDDDDDDDRGGKKKSGKKQQQQQAKKAKKAAREASSDEDDDSALSDDEEVDIKPQGKKKNGKAAPVKEPAGKKKKGKGSGGDGSGVADVVEELRMEDLESGEV